MRIVCGSGSRSRPGALRGGRAALGCPDSCDPHLTITPGGSPSRSPRAPLWPQPKHLRLRRGKGGAVALTRDKRRNKSVQLPLPLLLPRTKPGPVKTACPRHAGAPARPRSQPWHVLDLPGKRQCPSERSSAGRGPGSGTSALRHQAGGCGGSLGTSVSKAGLAGPGGGEEGERERAGFPGKASRRHLGTLWKRCPFFPGSL